MVNVQALLYLVPKKDGRQTIESVQTLPENALKQSDEVIFSWDAPRGEKLYFQSKTKLAVVD